MVLFSLVVMRVEAKDKYLIKVDVINEGEAIRANLGFAPGSFNAYGYDIFEDGYYLLNKADTEVTSTQSEYVFEIPEGSKNTSFKMIVTNNDGKFKTDAFTCRYIKDENEDNVCYQEYDYIGGLLKNVTNFKVLERSIDKIKDGLVSMVLITAILIIVAVMYNYVMKVKGAKNLANTDIFFIIFNVAVIIFSFVLYTVNLFKGYSQLVLTSVVLAVYYLIYYIAKLSSAKGAGSVRYLSALLGYLMVLCSSVLLLSYFI